MTEVNTAASVGGPTLNVQPVTPQAGPEEATAVALEHAADLRLIIEEDKIAGSYIYKTLDRRTGEIVQQFPREEIVKLRHAEAYNVGSVVNARV